MRQNLFNYLNRVGDEIGVDFYLVGGAVRDDLLGIESKDFDFVARGLPFDDLIAALSPYGKTGTTGQLFNVIRHFPEDRTLPPIEIALPRKDVSTGVGHNDFEARYDHTMSIEDDLLRRDYTVNSIAVSTRTGEIHDPLDGRSDLKAGVLRMLHPTAASDDALRIIRGLRFMAKLGFGVCPDTDRQLRDSVALLADVSSERFQDELLGMLTQPHVGKALRYAQDIGAIAVVFPELEKCVGCVQNHYHEFDVWEHTVRVVEKTPTSDPYVKLAALFHDIAKPVVKWIGPDGVAHFYDPEPGQKFTMEPEIAGNHEIVGADIAWNIMGRLCFSNQHQARVALLVREHMFGRDPKFSVRTARRFLSRLDGTPGGIEANMEALFEIRTGDTNGGKTIVEEDALAVDYRFRDMCRAELAKSSAFKVTDLAVNGHDLMSLGFKGKNIGLVQRELLAMVIDFPEANTRENLIEHALMMTSLNVPLNTDSLM